MLGSVIPEPDSVDHGPGAGVDVVRAHASPGQGLNFDLASPNPAVLGWNDWRYASDGTIDPSALGAGSNNSPGKLGDDANSPVHEFGDDGGARPSRTTDEEEEEDGKGRAAVVDSVVESPESVSATAGAEEEMAQGTCECPGQVPRVDVQLKSSNVRPVTTIVTTRGKRGEEYVPERDGGWHSWVAHRDSTHRAAPTPAGKSKSKCLADAHVFDLMGAGVRRLFTVSGEPHRQCVLARQQNAHPIRLTSRNIPCSTAAATTSPNPGAAAIAKTPDPEHDQPEQQEKTKGKGKWAVMARRGRRDGNLDEGGNGTNAGADTDDGIWHGEYVIPVQPAQAEDMVMITPEEVERAIGTAA
ncbi:hypothetical protein EDB89DRAFT_2074654 [Lactarius sanguifluus]|nr:hypothetical protein EDB89DRAFT_2074654 [Lactarius sanguifluus]